MLFKKWKKKPQIPGIVDYIPKNIALEHKRNAQEMISVSKEKYESRPREQPNGIEAKYEQYEIILSPCFPFTIKRVVFSTN